MMSDRPSTKLIRLCCDEDLSPEQAAELQRCLEAHPECRCEVERQLDADRRLRECIAKVLKASCPCAPGDLRRSIQECISTASPVGRIDPNPATAVNRPSRWRLLMSGQNRANLLAVAATLALIAGVVLYSIFARTIDQRPPMNDVDLVARAAVFADQEHGICSADAHQHTNPSLSAADAEADLSEHLGAPVTVFDLRDIKYEFVCAGRCAMPVPENSGHLTYRKV